MSICKSSLAALAVLLLAGASAYAQGSQARPENVVFKEDLKARERTIVTSFFSTWLDGNRDGKAETGIADVNGDGTAEIFVRLVHASTCDADMKVCRTFMLMHDGRQWNIVLDRPAATIALGRPGKNGMRAVVVNGYENRVWNGHSYQVDLAGMKAATPKFQDVVGQKAIELARGFGNSVERLVVARKVHVQAAVVNLGAKQGTAVRLAGEAACGLYIGCPLRILVDDGNGRQVAVLEAGLRADQNGRSDLKILDVTRGGWNSIATTVPDGTVLVADWEGARYGLEVRR